MSAQSWNSIFLSVSHSVIFSKKKLLPSYWQFRTNFMQRDMKGSICSLEKKMRGGVQHSYLYIFLRRSKSNVVLWFTSLCLKAKLFGGFGSLLKDWLF